MNNHISYGKMNHYHLQMQAEMELYQEAIRRAIDAEKIRILQRKTFWSRVFPFTITITRSGRPRRKNSVN